AMSGGVDSSVCAALAVRALGQHRVFGLFLPEQDSDPASTDLAEGWARKLEISYATENITPLLAAAGCYQRRDEAIRRLVPEFADGWRCKIVLPSARVRSNELNLFRLVVQSPNGQTQTYRLPPTEYREIVAATNFKQRVRKMLEYYHADRLHYAVLGTPNRLEFDQGFFVKGGDGLADLKPIAHLYKSEVYEFARHLGVPAEIISRPPTTDTYSLPQTQEEFYFPLPVLVMDGVLSAKNAGLDSAQAAQLAGLDAVEAASVYAEIDRKRAATRYLHMPPLLVEDVGQVAPDVRGTG
ncbi:MAG TPA: NAD(+) synthase, partial [Nitrospiraceae bacterium]|nr:NAD(+) synthase [Nitrospiraceae bacterium]